MDLSGKITKKDLFSLPKSELHCHLDGSVRLETIIDLAREYNVALPSHEQEKLAELLICGRKVEDLVAYLNAFGITLSVMQEKNALERIAFELAEDAASENVWYLEGRFSPTLHTQNGLKGSEIIEAVLRGFKKAEAKYEIKTGLIICAIREKSSEDSVKMAHLCNDYYGKGVVAFDLAGKEIGNPANDHHNAFRYIREKHINRTVHAGEAYGPASIGLAIEEGAHRIGHGISLIKDPSLLSYVNNHRIALEVCLKCNTQIGMPLSEHPLPEFIKKGLCITLNTDNRLMTATTLTDEYWLAVETYKLEWKEVKKIILCGFEKAFLPFDEKTKLLEKVKKSIS